MFKVSESAAKQVAISLDQMEEAIPLRIAIKVQEDGSFHYNMGFDDHHHGSDINFDEKDIKFVIDAGSVPLVSGMTMDYVEIEGKQEIVFLNPNDPNYVPPKD